ncbi:LOB DOMAIN-CONTAINING PROTEIN 4-RELATED [Salix koriyanagi]|uniref:LOB DOMAIN-CONTAINING PROTEIN 4-RELATED n=1 Tax=Salix koriyanagi TaxID=2511006 RepID=A0A9Q0W0P1_9ROSI|nr:LOB DOMAIN-CONTAINING PROTEIN 4-RELATED [Salix koriyanagi]
MKPPACAACRHQRRRCTPDCPLAPFFPPEKTKDFEAAHKLFGVHNIVSNLKKTTPEQKPESITSMVYEANARVRDPVSGCTGIISRLLQNINAVKVELEFVQAQVACFHTLQQQLGGRNGVDNVGFVDFLQENSSANNIDRSLNQDYNFLYENLQSPQQLQESSFAQATKLFDGVHQGTFLSIGQPAVKPERHPSSSSSKVHGKQPLHDVSDDGVSDKYSKGLLEHCLATEFGLWSLVDLRKMNNTETRGNVNSVMVMTRLVPDGPNN